MNSGNHTFELQMRINRARVEFCYLSNQTIKCALFVRLFFVYGNKRGIREGDMEENSGMPDFLKKKERLCGIRTPTPLQTVIGVKCFAQRTCFI